MLIEIKNWCMFISLSHYIPSHFGIFSLPVLSFISYISCILPFLTSTLLHSPVSLFLCWNNSAAAGLLFISAVVVVCCFVIIAVGLLVLELICFILRLIYNWNQALLFELDWEFCLRSRRKQPEDPKVSCTNYFQSKHVTKFCLLYNLYSFCFLMIPPLQTWLYKNINSNIYSVMCYQISI